MNPYIYASIVVLFISISIFGFTVMRDETFMAQSMVTSMPVVTHERTTPTPTVRQTHIPSITPTPVPSRSQTINYYYPMTRYRERMTNRWYGKRIVEKDKDPLPCGDAFSGFHTGDDLEVYENELNVETPIYAIADGTVRLVGAIEGYGGLIILEHLLEGEVVTAYYGHVDISEAMVRVGDVIQAGEQIAILGDHCSPQTSGERKHLHFSILKGRDIDVRGYIDNENDLNNWINPKNILQYLNAQNP